MKKFFVKFLLVNFFITIIFSSFFAIFWSIENAAAWSPYKLWTTDIMSDTDDRIINKQVTWTKIQSSSIMTSLIPNIFKLAFYLATSLAVLSIIYWWYLMITSLWQSWQQEKWWKIFWYSIVWLVLMLFSRAIVWIVSNIKITNNKASDSDSKFLMDDKWSVWNLPSWALETEVIPQLIQLLLQLVSVVLVWVIIYAWIIYITQWEEKKKEMWDLMMNAVIWLIIILVSYWLVAWILKINFW